MSTANSLDTQPNTAVPKLASAWTEQRPSTALNATPLLTAYTLSRVSLWKVRNITYENCQQQKTTGPINVAGLKKKAINQYKQGPIQHMPNQGPVNKLGIKIEVNIKYIFEFYLILST